MKTENNLSQLKSRIKIPRDGTWLFKSKQTWKLKGLAKLVFICYVKTKRASQISFQYYMKTILASPFCFPLIQNCFHNNGKSLLWLENYYFNIIWNWVIHLLEVMLPSCHKSIVKYWEQAWFFVEMFLQFFLFHFWTHCFEAKWWQLEYYL